MTMAVIYASQFQRALALGRVEERRERRSTGQPFPWWTWESPHDKYRLDAGRTASFVFGLYPTPYGWIARVIVFNRILMRFVSRLWRPFGAVLETHEKAPAVVRRGERHVFNSPSVFGAKGRARTADRTIFSRELYQLSYLGERHHQKDSTPTASGR